MYKDIKELETAYINSIIDISTDIENDSYFEDLGNCVLLYQHCQLVLEINYQNWCVIHEYILDLGDSEHRLRLIDEKLQSHGIDAYLESSFTEFLDRDMEEIEDINRQL